MFLLFSLTSLGVQTVNLFVFKIALNKYKIKCVYKYILVLNLMLWGLGLFVKYLKKVVLGTF